MLHSLLFRATTQQLASKASNRLHLDQLHLRATGVSAACMQTSAGGAHDEQRREEDQHAQEQGGGALPNLGRL
jgi:hypothetical protein